MKELKDAFEKVTELYSEGHRVVFNLDGTCGIESPAGKCEVYFDSPEELFNWIKTAEPEEAESYQDADPHRYDDIYREVAGGPVTRF